MEREINSWSRPRQGSIRYSRRSTPSTDARKILIRKESTERINLGENEHGSSEWRSSEQRSYEHKSREHDFHEKRQHHSDSVKIRKINEQASHHRHRLIQSSNKDGSWAPVSQLTYRPYRNNRDFGSRTWKLVGRRDVDVIKISTFNPWKENMDNNNRIKNDWHHK